MTPNLRNERVAELETFSRWLEQRVLDAGRGADVDKLDVDPAGRFWSGRLAPEQDVAEMGLGDRGERMNPCAVGLVIRVADGVEVSFRCRVQLRLWLKKDKEWIKSDPVSAEFDARIPQGHFGSFTFGEQEIARELSNAANDSSFSAKVQVETILDGEGATVLEITLINTSEPQGDESGARRILYEADLAISGIDRIPFQLVDLPDAFRYDRFIQYRGINCGVQEVDGWLCTQDSPIGEQRRRVYWSVDHEEPDLSFSTLAVEPLPQLELLAAAADDWAQQAWSDAELNRRQEEEGWSAETRDAADAEAEKNAIERRRIHRGIELLRESDSLLQSFKLMNEAIAHSSAGKYSGWRPFQIGFLLSCLNSIIDPEEESRVADVIWFATGGGKTETYLGLLVTAAFFERLNGKLSGITAWSRFPLRMLSLQQTQRFANALAGAELARQRNQIDGDPFSMGFFVGDRATPNDIKVAPGPGDFDPDDDEAISQAQVLMRCPFCHEQTVEMNFNRLHWKLEHVCQNSACPWIEEALPFYIVDMEIFRFLPTVVVGTLDKAASIAHQAAMRGFVGAPWGICNQDGHGYIYAPRSTRQTGCLVPDCPGDKGPLTQDKSLFPPSFRLQDELHLLRDSLGAVDSHYESIFDSLQLELSGRRPKILGSSATLSGFDRQVEALYQREGRVFPIPGPSEASSFWTSEGPELARRYVAIAPRGVTSEFVVDRIITVLQESVRLLATAPNTVCEEAGISPKSVETLLNLYGVNVVYGNTLRDLEATARSLETQIPVSPLITAALTGGTDFDDVRRILDRLDHPEDDFEDRIHVVTGSSMMSHGVDIDRLNSMIMLGMPLTAAEFIQATARIGRTHPGTVFVLHKISRERDASVFREFPNFVRQADRIVEPIPVTRKSRRVLMRTAGGAEMARVLALHEPRSRKALTVVSRLRDFFDDAEIDHVEESAAVQAALGLGGSMDELMIETLDEWFSVFFQNLHDPAGGREQPRSILPWMPKGPMISLRDVEEQATIRDGQ